MRTPNSPPKSFVWFLGANSETLPRILASRTTKDGLNRSLQEARVATPGHCSPSRIVPPFLEGPRRPTVWIEYKSGHAAESDSDFYTPVKESQISKLNMWGIPRLSSAVKW
ncbi:hypothetical protein N7497_012424 [Penicillium chrysogenum]|nr:hypothetical protein N7497_012424 [Penicillium chrysogenum]